MVDDRSKAPAIHDAVEFEYKLPPINQEQLSNGLVLYWLNAGVQDVVEIDWVFPGGLWWEKKPAVSHAVAGLLKTGTSKRTAHQINEALEFYGASLKANAHNDYSMITLYTLTKHLPALLPIVNEIITEATFPETEMAIYKQNTIQRLLVHERECDFVANQRIDALLFGEAHPYGRYSKKEKIEAINREDVVAFHKVCYNLANMKIFMAGKVGAKEVKAVDDVFGRDALHPEPLTQDTFAAPAPSDKKMQLINDPNGVQGAIRIGRVFPTRHDPDFAPMVVLNTLFGGYFGSRLMSNIREDKGYTYGIYSSLSPYLQSGSLIIHTEVGRDVVEPAVKEIYKEMKALCEKMAPEEELLLVKNYLLGNLLGDLDGPFSIIQRWRTLILNDLDVEHFNRNVNIYKTITAKELKELSNKYLCTDDFYEVVVI
ncbi:M16 family metallopeptidase [Polluticoccus soli]|uniref:M16 family metallopeptidase n=1 Tax=Polluticoccus soli TaxID=3034150 RepID=UPI0023E1A3ED|nr:pitrilysin family protein [Flavipsychrobacter sp. JY13-12]